ncbi:MAG: hypothetical protein Q9187_005193 [Circinaria calcarea]
MPISSISSPARAPFPSHVASNQYVEQYRALVDHQRQVHDEERALWHLERQELHGRVAELEASVRQYRIRLGREASSPSETSDIVSGAFFPSQGPPRATSASTGDEYWRGAGGRADARPSRTFSEPSSAVTKLPGRRMSSIAEDDGIYKLGKTSGKQHKLRHKASIDGVKIDKNLDGIMFKPSSLPPAIVETIITPQTPSPLCSPSADRPFLNHIKLPPSQPEKPEDPYTKHAGHTPLARRTSHSDSDSIHLGSDPPTADPPEKERPPLEPCPSFARPPNERSDSYFPRIMDNIEEDAELKPPLTLQNNGAEDNPFLSELDSKLLDVAKSETLSPTPNDGNTEDTNRPNENPVVDQINDFDQLEPEPMLKIKRSMNFGSQFGAPNCGKGI